VEHTAIANLTAVASDTVSKIGIGPPLAVGGMPRNLQPSARHTFLPAPQL
jgi:hypothetical protein